MAKSYRHILRITNELEWNEKGGCWCVNGFPVHFRQAEYAHDKRSLESLGEQMQEYDDNGIGYTLTTELV